MRRTWCWGLFSTNVQLNYSTWSCIYRDRAVYGTYTTTDVNGELLEALMSRIGSARSEATVAPVYVERPAGRCWSSAVRETIDRSLERHPRCYCTCCLGTTHPFMRISVGTIGCSKRRDRLRTASCDHDWLIPIQFDTAARSWRAAAQPRNNCTRSEKN